MKKVLRAAENSCVATMDGSAFEKVGRSIINTAPIAVELGPTGPTVKSAVEILPLNHSGASERLSNISAVVHSEGS